MESIAQELALGRVQFGFANADDVVVYRRQGVDVVAVLAAMQDNPRCILVQKQSGVESLSDLAGLTLQCQAGRPYLEFMRSKGLLGKVKEVPSFGSEVVRDFVQATKIGWESYLKDPTKANADILEANDHGMTANVLKYGSEQMRSLAIPSGVGPEVLGTMSLERWTMLVNQMDALDSTQDQFLN